MITFFTMLVHDENGATMVEYGLMVAMIAVVCFGAVTALGQSIIPLFEGASAPLTP